MQTIDQAHFLCKEEHCHWLVVQTGGWGRDRVLSRIFLQLFHTTHALQFQHLLNTGKAIPGVHEPSTADEEHATSGIYPQMSPKSLLVTDNFPYLET